MFYEDLKKLPESIQGAIRDPYDICVGSLIRRVREFMDEGGMSSGQVSYIFDRREGVHRVRDAFERSAQKQDSRIGVIGSARAREFYPLQVADILAFEIRKEYLRQHRLLDLPNRRWPCEKLMACLYFEATTLDPLG